MDIHDSLIVEELKKGSHTGIRLLVEKFQSRLFSWGRRYYEELSPHDILELINDTFLRIIYHIDAFELRSETAFRNWIFTIFRNLIIDFLRKQKRTVEYKSQRDRGDYTKRDQDEKFDSFQQELDKKAYQEYLLPETEEHRLKPIVRDFLNTLDEKNRTILLACAMNIPHREISTWVGIPRDHVKVYYSRLKKRLEIHILKLEKVNRYENKTS